MIYKLNGEIFDVNNEHLINSVDYPRNWFLDATNRAAMGITEEAELIYVVKDWFWLVGIAPTQVYSSKLGIYVALTHPDYVAFLGNGKVAVLIDTENNLADVLRNNGVSNWYECLTDPVVKAQTIVDAGKDVHTKIQVAPDFLVQSPKIKANKKEAYQEAKDEFLKTEKSIAKLALTLPTLIAHLEALELRIVALEKK